MHGMATESGDPTNLSLLAVVAFTTYTGLYTYIIQLYVRALYRHHTDNFYLFLRVPELMLLEGVCNWFIGITVALRQVVSEAGYGFPCAMSHLATAVGCLLFAFPHLFRTAKAIVMSRVALRRKYMPYFSQRAMRAQLVAVSLGVGGIEGIAMRSNSCKTYDFCHADNCMALSGWYWAVPLVCVAVVCMVAEVIAVHVMRIKGAMGAKEELVQILVILTVFMIPYTIIIMLMDVGKVAGYRWERAATAIFLTADALWLYYGALLPAVRYGYSPWTTQDTPELEAQEGESLNPERERSRDRDSSLLPALNRFMHKASSRVTPANGAAGGLQRVPSAGELVALDSGGDDADPDFGRMFKAPQTYEAFLEYCKPFLCQEHVMFIYELDKLDTSGLGASSRTEEREIFRQTIVSIVDRFIAVGSQYDLGLNFRTVQPVLKQRTKYGRRKYVFVDESVEFLRMLTKLEAPLRRKIGGTIFREFQEMNTSRLGSAMAKERSGARPYVDGENSARTPRPQVKRSQSASPKRPSVEAAQGGIAGSADARLGSHSGRLPRQRSIGTAAGAAGGAAGIPIPPSSGRSGSSATVDNSARDSPKREDDTRDNNGCSTSRASLSSSRGSAEQDHVDKSARQQVKTPPGTTVERSPQAVERGNGGERSSQERWATPRQQLAPSES